MHSHGLLLGNHLTLEFELGALDQLQDLLAVYLTSAELHQIFVLRIKSLLYRRDPRISLLQLVLVVGDEIFGASYG